MNDIFPAAAESGVVRARLQPHLTSVNTGPHEMVELYAGDQHLGYCVLPRDAAYDVISRLEDTPPILTHVDRAIAGQVRYLLDAEYRVEADAPTEWEADLIVLINGAGEEERRRLGRIYPAQVVAVAIATGPGGIDALRRWHEQLPGDAPAASRAAGG